MCHCLVPLYLRLLPIYPSLSILCWLYNHISILTHCKPISGSHPTEIPQESLRKHPIHIPLSLSWFPKKKGFGKYPQSSSISIDGIFLIKSTQHFWDPRGRGEPHSLRPPAHPAAPRRTARLRALRPRSFRREAVEDLEIPWGDGGRYR